MISVCLISHNGEKYIKEQIESILCQLADEDELIVSDDNSSDNTVDIITSIIDARIKLFEKGNFNSPIKNIEFAINQSTGDYIYLSDQDDVWIPNKVEIMNQYLADNSLVISDAYVCDHELNINSTFFKGKSLNSRVCRFINNPYLGCCMAFRKEMIPCLLPFPPKIAMHDIWIGWVIDTVSNSQFIDEPLIYFRRHNSNASTTSKTSSNSFMKKVKIRIYLIVSLILRIIRVKHDRSINNNSNI